MATILVIDDDFGMRRLLSQILGRSGYSVVLAADGFKGLELYNRELPDAVILDLSMPGLHGLTVLRKLRALNEVIPVIILTEETTDGVETDARLLGATAFFKKRCALNEIGDALKALLGGAPVPF